jgi:hypothetical protein
MCCLLMAMLAATPTGVNRRLLQSDQQMRNRREPQLALVPQDG